MTDSNLAQELNTGAGANRFKFQSFSSRVDRIKVDIVRRSRLVEDDPDKTDSFFYESLDAWVDLNQSKTFTEFVKEIRPLVKTLPSILYYKDKIIGILEKYLLQGDPLALDGLLDLVTKLAKDLEGEFYPYFPRIINSITPLARLEDVKILECLFNCIAYLFKFLSRQILPDLCDVFGLFSHLLGQDEKVKPYIQHFTAEAFAFLMRKARGKALTDIVHRILGTLQNNPSKEYVEGLAMLFFECMQQVNSHLHSRAEAVYRELLQQIMAIPAEDGDLDADAALQLLSKSTLLILHHSKREHFGPIINIILANMDQVASQSTRHDEQMAVCVHVLAMCVTVRKASRVADFTPILERVQPLAKKIFTASPGTFSASLCNEVLQAATGILTFGSLQSVASSGRLLLDTITAYQDPTVIYGFLLGLSKVEWNGFTQLVLPSIVKYSANAFEKSPQQTVLFLAELFSSNALDITPGMMSSQLTPEGLLRYPTQSLPQGLLEMLKAPYDWKAERDILNATNLEQDEDQQAVSSIMVLTAALVLIPRIQLPFEDTLQALLSLMTSLQTFLYQENTENPIVHTSLVVGHVNFAVEAFLGQVIKALVGLTTSNQAFEKIIPLHDTLVDNILLKCNGNEVVLLGVLDYLELLRTSNKHNEKFSLKRLEQIYPTLKHNLSSYHVNSRLNTLKILALYDQPMMKMDEDHREPEECDIVQIAIDMEEIVPDLRNTRDKIKLIHKLNILTGGGRLPDLYNDLTLQLAIALMTMNVQPLWKEAQALLVICANQNQDLFLDTVIDVFSRFDDERQLVRDGFSTEAFAASHQSIPAFAGQETKTGNLSFECPTYARYVYMVNKARTEVDSDMPATFTRLFIQLNGQTDARVDFWNWHVLLLKCLKDTAEIVARRTRQFVPMFMKFLNDEFNAVTENEDTTADQEEDVQEQDEQESDEMKDADSSLGLLVCTRRTTKAKMIAWLDLFGAFKNIRSAYQADQLHTIFLNLLTNGDSALQNASLLCVLLWKDPNITPYADNLKRLVHHTRFRDSLSQLIEDEERTIIEPSHRQGLMPIVMRILYGRLIQSHGKGDKSQRRKVICGAVACCPQNEMELFFGHALAQFKAIEDLPGVEYDADGQVTRFAFVDQGDAILNEIPWRRQAGLLGLMEDMIKPMGLHIIPFLPRLIKVVLYMINFAHAKTSNDMQVDEETAAVTKATQSERSKDIRTLAVKRLVDFFSVSTEVDFTPYIPAVFSSFLSARITDLTNQATIESSTILSLLTAWADSPSRVVYFTGYDDRLIPQLFSLLSVKKITAGALSTVLNIIDHMLDHCEKAMEIDGVSLVDRILTPYVDDLFKHLKYRVMQTKDEKQFGSGKYSVHQIVIVSRIAPFVKDGEQAAAMVDMLLPYLKKPKRHIPETTKQMILSVWHKVIRIIPGFVVDSNTYNQYYTALASLFAVLETSENRKLLLELFQAFVDINPSLQVVHGLLVRLNSYGDRRTTLLDYDQNIDALNSISDDLATSLDSHAWLPLLYQCFFSMHDPDEMAIRGSAANCVIQFMKMAANKEEGEEKRKLLNYVNHIIYPAIKQGLSSHIELIRSEFLGVLNAAIKTFPTNPNFAPMVPLADDSGEETNFFENVYHLQIHRRTRALMRLAEFARTGSLSIASIKGVFLPIINAFFFETSRTADHNLVHQCIQALTELARQLPFSSYYQLLKNYISLNSRKEDMEKLFVRVITGILEAFHFDLSGVEVTDEDATKIMGQQKVMIHYISSEQIAQASKDAAEAEAEASEARASDQPQEEVEEAMEKMESQDQATRIHNILITRVLPELNAYLNNPQSKENVVVRIPIALGIAKLLRCLPEKSMRLNLPGLLITLCQTVRSRALDVRDMVRQTLVKVNQFLGHSYMSFIIKELRTALTKGYEIYVLGYTVNVLLADTLPRIQVGDLDYCLKDITDVLMRDMFRLPGQDQDNELVISRIKEARNPKSLGMFEKLSQAIHVKNVGLLLLPLKDIMSETESLKTLRKVDDILRNIALGLAANPEFDSMELLEFARGLISENLDSFKPTVKVAKVKTQQEKNFEVQLKRDALDPVDYYSANAHRFVFFGLSLFYTALKRKKLDPRVDAHREKLESFLDLVGNTLYSNHTNNVIIACKIMGILLKYPLKGVPEAFPVVIKRMFQLIKQAGNTHSPLVQNCFRLLTICIYDADNANLTDHQLTYLLNVIRPDLEEPERQGTVFAVVRAIISRKFMTPDLYDLIDVVARIMVTNQTKEIRGQARSVYFMFLMDYPQGRNRLKTNVSFIIKNLEYVYETGRISIMELLHQIVTKFGDDILMEFAEPMLLALILRLVNDDSARCREMAAELIKNLLYRYTDDKMATVYRLLGNWLEQTQKPNLQRAAIQVYGLAIDTFETQFKPEVPRLMRRLKERLELCEQQLRQEQPEDEDEMAVDVPWEIAYYSLNTFSKVAKTFPNMLYGEDTTRLWQSVNALLLHPHAWIRSSTTRLFGIYFSQINAEDRSESGKKIAFLDRDTLKSLAAHFTGQLSSQYLTDEQAGQNVRNLFFVGKCMYHLPAEEDIVNEAAAEVEVAAEDAEETGGAPDTAPAPDVGNTEADSAGEDAENAAAAKADHSPEAVASAGAKLDQPITKHTLFWMCRFLAKTARKEMRKKNATKLPRMSIFKWFAAMANYMDADDLAPFLTTIIDPLYYVTTDDQDKREGAEELKMFGNEVLGLLQKKAGPTVYFTAYQRVRQRIVGIRLHRKAKRAIEAVTNPSAYAKRKQERNRREHKRKRAKLAAERNPFQVKP